METYLISSDFIVLVIRSIDVRLEGEKAPDGEAAVDVDIIAAYDINEINLIYEKKVINKIK